MCIDDIDALQPYRPAQAESPDVGRLKRKIAIQAQEIACWRELNPGKAFNLEANAIEDIGHEHSAGHG